jgi:hypothetical protein
MFFLSRWLCGPMYNRWNYCSKLLNIWKFIFLGWELCHLITHRYNLGIPKTMFEMFCTENWPLPWLVNYHPEISTFNHPNYRLLLFLQIIRCFKNMLNETMSEPLNTVESPTFNVDSEDKAIIWCLISTCSYHMCHRLIIMKLCIYT